MEAPKSVNRKVRIIQYTENVRKANLSTKKGR